MTPFIFSKEHVENYVKDVKALVQKDQCQFELNYKRPDNRLLFEKYILDEAHAKEIIMSLEADDFSEARKNKHSDHPDEILYIFGKDVQLAERYSDIEKLVPLYIKFNKINGSSGPFLIVVSFHEQKWNLKYQFK